MKRECLIIEILVKIEKPSCSLLHVSRLVLHCCCVESYAVCHLYVYLSLSLSLSVSFYHSLSLFLSLSLFFSLLIYHSLSLSACLSVSFSPYRYAYLSLSLYHYLSLSRSHSHPHSLTFLNDFQSWCFALSNPDELVFIEINERLLGFRAHLQRIFHSNKFRFAHITLLTTSAQPFYSW